ncbi:MAG TPA: hypothetical protein VMU28_07020 [Terriglobales bacterium]|nr:hypothetical protein [Terriglobales bacterium]
MTSSQDVRLWLIPQRFWATTRNMDKVQADNLMEKVIELAEKRDVEALRKYDFVWIDQDQRSIA